jgi:hypothetical protein
LTGKDRAEQESVDRRETLKYLAQLRKEDMRARQQQVESRQMNVRALLARLKGLERDIWTLARHNTVSLSPDPSALDEEQRRLEEVLSAPWFAAARV